MKWSACFCFRLFFFICLTFDTIPAKWEKRVFGPVVGKRSAKACGCWKFPNHKVSQSGDADWMCMKCLSHLNNTNLTVCFIKIFQMRSTEKGQKMPTTLLCFFFFWTYKQSQKQTLSKSKWFFVWMHIYRDLFLQPFDMKMSYYWFTRRHVRYHIRNTL